MFSEKYPSDMKFLAGINARDMDSWVFEEAQVSLNSQAQNPNTRPFILSFF